MSRHAWISAPEQARAAPARSAASTRGTRTFSKMLRAVAETSPPKSHATSSGRLTDEAPSVSAAAVTATSKTAVTATTATLREVEPMARSPFRR